MIMNESNRLSRTYILSGGTGFLGLQLAKKILADGHKIIFIGRKKKDKSLEIRMNEILPSQYLLQIRCVEFDIEYFDVDKVYSDICNVSKDIDGFWHLAANLSFREKDRSKVFKINIEGVSKIIEICKKLNCQLYYTSTAYVHGRDSGIAFERFEKQPKIFNNPYEESKFRAEILLKNEKDLNYIIFRPSILIEPNGNDITNFGYYSFIFALIRLRESFNLKQETRFFLPLPFFYYKNSLLNLMPSDIAVRWMYLISKSIDANKKIFHICNPKPLYIKDILRQTFQAVKLKLFLLGVPKYLALSYFIFLDLLSKIIRPLKYVAKRIYYFKWYMLEHVEYDMKNTKKIIDEDIDKLFDLKKTYIYDLATQIVLKQHDK